MYASLDPPEILLATLGQVIFSRPRFLTIPVLTDVLTKSQLRPNAIFSNDMSNLVS